MSRLEVHGTVQAHNRDTRIMCWGETYAVVASTRLTAPRAEVVTVLAQKEDEVRLMQFNNDLERKMWFKYNPGWEVLYDSQEQEEDLSGS